MTADDIHNAFEFERQQHGEAVARILETIMLKEFFAEVEKKLCRK